MIQTTITADDLAIIIVSMFAPTRITFENATPNKNVTAIKMNLRAWCHWKASSVSRFA